MLEEIQLQQVLPQEIEKRSFEIITEELGNVELDPLQAPIIKRAIHTSADFDYLKNLTFSELAVEQFHTAIKNGACIVTDTQMAKSGINKKELAKYGGEVYCFMSDDDVAEIAKKQGSTRAVASMEKACMLDKPLIFAIGNAPTALVRLYELMEEGRIAATVTQEPFAQGDEAVRVLFDYIHTGRRPAAGVVYTHNRVRVRHSQ